jgi:ATP-binding protein involved in chromosome partitioning
MAYRTIARRISARLAKQSKDFSSAFPNIVIKND